MSIKRRQVDLYQGDGYGGSKFGYVFGDEGGFFFTWLDSLEATLGSVHMDRQDGDGGLDESEVVDFLREYLPTTQLGKALWCIDE